MRKKNFLLNNRIPLVKSWIFSIFCSKKLEHLEFRNVEKKYFSEYPTFHWKLIWYISIIYLNHIINIRVFIVHTIICYRDERPEPLHVACTFIQNCICYEKYSNIYYTNYKAHNIQLRTIDRFPSTVKHSWAVVSLISCSILRRVR